METNKCSVCGEEMAGLEPTAADNLVCPKCAAAHFLPKTQQIRVLRVLLDMYGLDGQKLDAATLYQIASDLNQRLQAKPADEAASPPAA